MELLRCLCLCPSSNSGNFQIFCDFLSLSFLSGISKMCMLVQLIVYRKFLSTLFTFKISVLQIQSFQWSHLHIYQLLLLTSQIFLGISLENFSSELQWSYIFHWRCFRQWMPGTEDSTKPHCHHQNTFLFTSFIHKFHAFFIITKRL